MSWTATTSSFLSKASTAARLTGYDADMKVSGVSASLVEIFS